MTISKDALKMNGRRAIDVDFRGDQVVISLEGGLVMSVPLHQLPPLAEATQEERSNWEFIADGLGVHWPAVDEYVLIEDLLYRKMNNPTGLGIHIDRCLHCDQPDCPWLDGKACDSPSIELPEASADFDDQHVYIDDKGLRLPRKGTISNLRINGELVDPESHPVEPGDLISIQDNKIVITKHESTHQQESAMKEHPNSTFELQSDEGAIIELKEKTSETKLYIDGSVFVIELSDKQEIHFPVELIRALLSAEEKQKNADKFILQKIAKNKTRNEN